MKPLSKAVGAVLDALTSGLNVGDARKIDNSNGTYMVVHVDRLSEKRFSIAHYYEQAGDLVPDPDGVFLKTDAGWLPVSLQLCTGHYTVAVEVDDDDKPIRWSKRSFSELVSFAGMWTRNIAQQQGGVARIVEAARKAPSA